MNKLRVLHLIPNLKKGGAERFTLDLCKALSERDDVEVLLVTFLSGDEYEYISKYISVKRIKAKFIPSITGENDIDAKEYIETVDDFRPDIIHTHLFRAELMSSLYLPDFVKAYVTHGHDNMVQYKNPSVGTLLSKRALTNYFEKRILLKKYTKVTNYFIANSLDTLSYFNHVLPTPLNKNVVLIEYGFDFNRFVNESDPKQKNDNKLILTNVGSFVDKKNQKFILEIASRLRGESIDFEIHFLGDGVNKAPLEKKSVQLGLGDNVFFHGNVNRVEEWLWKSTIYLHAARYEPFGLVFLEAMAAGLPCIALDGKGNRGLIKEGETGYFFSDENIEQFVEAIKQLNEDESLYKNLSKNAVEFAHQYDIALKTNELMEFYSSITKG